MDLKVQSGPDTGKIFQIGSAPMVVGRQVGTEIVINDNQVSRRHAQFEVINGTLVVNDLGSVNGTLLNGQRLAPNQPQYLKAGDEILVGQSILVVQPTIADDSAKTEQFNLVATPPVAQQPYNNVQPTYNAPPVQQYVATPPQYQQRPPAQHVKSGNRGLLVGGLLAILALTAVAIGAIYLLASTDEEISGVFVPTTSEPTTLAPEPAVTLISGISGTNILPPSPPAAIAARPTPTVSSSRGGGASQSGRVTALGVVVEFPTGWKPYIDESKNLIEGNAPDDITYAQIRRYSSLKGTPSERLNRYLEAIKGDLSDLKIIKAVKTLTGNDEAAEAYVTYSDSENLLHRDYIIATLAPEDDTYIIYFSTEDSKFDGMVDTFNKILKSIII